MKTTNKHNLPASIFEALTKETYDLDKSDTKKLSVTSLIDSPLIRQLRIRHWEKLEQDASDLLWVLLGQSVHSVLDRVSDHQRLKEERLTALIGGYEFSGKPDLYDGDTHVITDYKVTSVWAYIFGKEEWDKQLNCYAWLLRKLGFQVDGLKIAMILRDWSSSKAGDNEYPAIPFVQRLVPDWGFEAQEKYVLERLALHSSAEGKADKDIPVCSPTERWQSKTTYAVKKAGRKTALRVLDSLELAEKWKSENSGDSVEIRQGTDRRCTEYCSVKQFCPYWQANYKGKTLEERS